MNFIDITTAEQNLVVSVTAYLQALAGEWQAVADIGALLQNDETLPAATECLPALPDFERALVRPR